MSEIAEFLRCTDVIDWDRPAVLDQAEALAVSDDPLEVARACFEWVRDEIQHSSDYQRDPATCRASDVLHHRTGYCYAKSHLLAAFLRANRIPAGFCYQRLSVSGSGPPYCLHGFNAIRLPGIDWYRIDARGNRPDLDVQFTPPTRQLAFPLKSEEEVEFDNIFSNPLESVVRALQESTGWRDVLAHLPDVEPEQFSSLGLVVKSTGQV